MSQVIFEGVANVYKYDKGEDIFECCVFGYALQEQAQKQLDMCDPDMKECCVGLRPRRVRVEILD